jgi:serine phosphatase RsbU (regulator of sigma subunit)
MACFVIGALLVRGAIERNGDYQRTLRLAQQDRARVFSLQLDEETGIRGFLDTGMPTFLQPYAAARRAFPGALDDLHTRIHALGLVHTAVHDEAALNARWLREIAMPALERTRDASRPALQIEGKTLVDRFRSANASLNAMLAAAAAQGDRRTKRLVSNLLLGSLAGGALVAGLFLWAGVRQQHLREELEDQRRVADVLQEAFLRSALPKMPGAALSAIYVPARLEAKVGGDWYDAYELSPGRIFFSIGDVAGHGVEAAVVMSRVRQALLALATIESDPARLLANANCVLLMQESPMVTALCGFVDVARGLVTIASAGHPPALFAHPGGVIRSVGAGGPPLGSFESASYAASEIEIYPGTLLVLYTDGLIEFDRDWSAGESRLLEVVKRISPGAAEPADAIFKRVLRGAAPGDDVAILTIRFTSGAAVTSSSSNLN